MNCLDAGKRHHRFPDRTLGETVAAVLSPDAIDDACLDCGYVATFTPGTGAGKPVLATLTDEVAALAAIGLMHLCGTMPTVDPEFVALVTYCREHIEHADNWTDTYGVTCDERGCGICNADSPEQAALDWFNSGHANPNRATRMGGWLCRCGHAIEQDGRGNWRRTEGVTASGLSPYLCGASITTSRHVPSEPIR